jgi:poly(3-hydroxybutyrate) depolymerase
VKWQLAASADGVCDVKATLKATSSELLAYVGGSLHVEAAGRYYFLIGADDGLAMFVDGKRVHVRDEARPVREDDSQVAVDLAAGDHEVLWKLRQRDGAWAIRTRLVDAKLGAPAGAYVRLAGTSAADAVDLASKMMTAHLDHGLTPSGYLPRLTVRFPAGAPRGVPLGIRAALTPTGGGKPIFDVDLGPVPLDAEGVHDLDVLLPAITGDEALAAVENKDLAVEIAGPRAVRIPFRPLRAVRESVALADRALAPLAAAHSNLPAGTRDTVRFLEERLERLASNGDHDREALDAEARELAEDARAIEQGHDPYAVRTGPQRRAYHATADGELHEFGLYVPPGYRGAAHTDRKYPLIVALHGLNGRPMAMLRWLFGGDDPEKDQDWEDRHVGTLPALDAFVVAPDGHGNAMYRELGEDDVVGVMDWALANLPVDDERVTITGPSMGGIGTAAVAFHNPDRFAAAAPLCGYHSYFVRRDVLGHPLRPWEKVLAEERSNVMWAENGAHIPLWIVHGTLDTPAANSGVLVDRYKELKYSMTFDAPELGHNVWQTTYENLKGAKWLLRHRRPAHPAEVRFRTVRTRYGDSAWVHVDELAHPDAWGEVVARARGHRDGAGSIDVSTHGVAVLALDRDAKLVGEGDVPVTVNVDGTALAFAGDEALVMHRDEALARGAWQKGKGDRTGPHKHGAMTGPIRDAFHEPLLFVYGASDPGQARANEEVAHAWAKIRPGVHVKYPIVSDTEFFAHGESLANEHALFLVGNARSNRVVAALESHFPLRIEGDAVVLDRGPSGAAPTSFRGTELGAAFIRPNPMRTDRYVVVVEGVDPLGTWRSLSLPDLLPDFVVYDAAVAPSRGQILLSSGAVRAGGFFENDWSFPTATDDPLAVVPRPGPKNEYEATPYLP